MTAPQAGASEACRGFRWIGQSLLCCDECGSPWFLHEGHAKYEGIFDPKMIVEPFTDEEKAQVPGLIAAWERNAFWQRETHWQRRWDGTGDSIAVHVERQVGKDFPYPTGPTRPHGNADSGASS